MSIVVPTWNEGENVFPVARRLGQALAWWSPAASRPAGTAALSSLRSISDPAAGCFMFRRPVIEEVDLRPVGRRILIERLVRGKHDSILEEYLIVEPLTVPSSQGFDS